VFVSSPGNTIGGALSEERNVISGNAGNGVTFTDPAGNGNVVAGNYIGTNLNGSAALPNNGSGVFITSGAANNTIGGTAGARNVVSGNTFSGIDIRGNNNIVQGNFIGTDPNGDLAIPNNDGVFLADTATGNLIGGPGSNLGNLISGNRFSGVKIMSLVAGVAGARQTTVQGNLIGTKASGLEALPNVFDGVFIENASNNIIGGGSAAARNIISGNGSNGVDLQGAFSTGNQVAGNYIGTDVTGAAAVPNAFSGVFVSASSNTVGPANVISRNSTGVFLTGIGTTQNVVKGNRIGTSADGASVLGNSGNGVLLLNGASNNTIGGLQVADANVISGNQFGMGIAGVATSGNKVWGNLIGTNPAGNAALGNLTHGINLADEASNNFIGGAEPGAGNVIAGNVNGMLLLNGATNNVIQGNRIGISASGAAIPNDGNGIYIDGAIANTIGGTAPNAGNVIAFNNGTGVFVATGTRNAIRGNAIFSHTFLGIHLGPNGVLPNDPLDTDSGPNNLQNYPELTLAEAGSTIVQGTLNSTPNTLFALDFFASSVADPSGFGEGQRFLGSINVTTEANGSVAFSATLAAPSAVGEFITATATDPLGNTSEFSAVKMIANVGAVAGHITNDAATPAALANIAVKIFDSVGTLTTTVSTDQSGNYRTTPGLTPGTYFVRTENTQQYLDQLNANIPCVPTCTPTSGAAVTVTGGATTTVNFSLTPGGSIAGQVTDDVTHAALSNVIVDVYNSVGTLVTTSSTDASGNYVTPTGLAAGNYFARTRGAAGHSDELYNNIPCISCDVTTGTTIGVATATRTSNINFALTPAAILVADSPIEGVTGRILKVSSDGSSVTVFANTTGCPTKMARRPSGNILAADPCNSRILEITPAGGISTLPSPGIQVPYAIAIEPASGNIFVADNFADIIYRITPGGAVSQFAVIPGGSPFTLQNISLAVSGLDVIAAYDDYNGVSGQTAIIKIDPTGAPITTLFQGTAIGSMGGLALDSSGTFVIPDGAHNRLVRFNPVGGTITPIAADPVALCCDMLGVTIDGSGNFIVAVNSQHRLVRITPAGVITPVVTDPQLRKSHALLMYP
jgi:hypothetical protein